MMRRNYWFIGIAIAWTVIFAAMSFYWAMGGLLGVRSLGGSIYEMSLQPTPSFVLIVWMTGFVKLLGVVLLSLLLIDWKKAVMNHTLYIVTKLAGVFLFLYGLLNSITISLSALQVLQFDLDSYAMFWRLFFWEPFWMAGGIFYFFAVKRIK